MESFKIYKPEELGTGEFDNGKITEIKPIDFPHGTGKGKRIGPLFYWAWASAKGDGVIGMHPHQAFEIMSYGLEGIIGHSDSAGNKTQVGAGGAQVIQAGTGIYHQEEMFGERTEFFQIWFEPYLQETIKHPPEYNQYESDQFPVTDSEGVKDKCVIGDNSPISIVADVLANDITISSDSKYNRKLQAGKCLALMTINGSGQIIINNDSPTMLEEKNYAVIQTDKSMNIEFKPENNSELRLFIIEVPYSVDYPLYGE